jgi:outer membrane immunogenic protein
MKKLLVAAAVAGLVGTANAQNAFEGFYGQLGIGYENNSVKFSNGAVNGNPDAASDANKSYSGGSFSGAIGLGYGFAIDKNWLLTVGADYSPLTSNTSTTTFNNDDGTSDTLKFSVSNRYNVFIAPGYVIDNNKLVYAKAGYSAQSVKMKASVGDYFNNPSKNLSGYVLGLGYKQLIDKNIYFFGEGNYMNYSSANASGTSADARTVTYGNSATAYQFLVGVGYKF